MASMNSTCDCKKDDLLLYITITASVFMLLIITMALMWLKTCTCGNCARMPTEAENVCCKEIPPVVRRMGDTSTPVSCMTLHPGLEPVCLNIYSLQNALNIYRADYGPLRDRGYERYKSLIRNIRSLQDAEQRVTEELTPTAPKADPVLLNSSPLKNHTAKLKQSAVSTSAAKSQTTRKISRSQRRSTQTNCRFNKADLNLDQLIKAGREGVFYKAKLMHGTIRGHSRFTCKVSKKGCNHRQVEHEVSVMQKLGTHKNLLQLLEWDITDAPYMLVMEYVAHGTLRSFLQVNQNELSSDEDLQHHFTLAAYHIAHAMKHLRSKMILHCDLALRNIMVHSFPREVKVAEFGLAREVTRTWSRRGSCKKDYKDRVPSRWYPPEYFKSDFYGFKGDVWSFGIVLWEMQTFGTLPYPNLNTSEEVARFVCAGHRNSEPEQCRPEIQQMMKDCWQEPYSLRPSFMDIVGVLENILETDRDYVDMDTRNESGSVEPVASETVTTSEVHTVYCNESQVKSG